MTSRLTESNGLRRILTMITAIKPLVPLKTDLTDKTDLTEVTDKTDLTDLTTINNQDSGYQMPDASLYLVSLFYCLNKLVLSA
jgi:hypothetical protein